MCVREGHGISVVLCRACGYTFLCFNFFSVWPCFGVKTGGEQLNTLKSGKTVSNTLRYSTIVILLVYSYLMRKRVLF